MRHILRRRHITPLLWVLAAGCATDPTPRVPKSALAADADTSVTSNLLSEPISGPVGRRDTVAAEPSDPDELVIRPDTVAVLPGTDIAHRVLALGAPAHAASGVRLLVGGDGVRAAGAAQVRRGAGSRVVPLAMGAGTLGYIWRAGEGATERTLAAGQSFGIGGFGVDTHRVTYLEAATLSPEETWAPKLDEAHAWAIVATPAGGALDVETPAGVVADAFVFAERDADTWIRTDDASLADQPARLEIPTDRAAVLVLHRIEGAGMARARVVGGAERVAARDPWLVDGWRALVADDGEMDSYWGMISSPEQRLAKRLALPVDPGALSGARVVYCMGAEPYDPPSRAHAPLAGVEWADLVIEVNGHAAFRGALDPAGREGWHRAPISPSLLVRGENEIRFRVDGRQYVYLSIDEDTEEKRSGVVTDGRLDTSTLRPRRVVHGEYLVRLEVR